MSRKPPTTSTSRGALARVPSNTAIASHSRDMPPPTSRVPLNRPASSQSTIRQVSSSSSHGAAAGPSSTDDESASGGPGGKRTKQPKAAQDVDENGEINIQVVVRCRGRSPLEIQQRTPIITSTTGTVSGSITVETSPSSSSLGLGGAGAALGLGMSSLAGSGGGVSKTYAFDKVFGPEADQTCVYREVGESMLDEVLRGYNCTIFAYGQTGTGKTYTMQGDLTLTPLQTPSSDAGIIPRVLHRLFQLLDATAGAEWSVKCSYVELYNEELRDLLAAEYREPGGNGAFQPMGLGATNGSGAQGQAPGGLKIYEDQNKRGGVTIQGLEETSVRSLGEALGLLIKGTQRRQVAETKMNSESSRSHSIFSLTVHLKETGAGHAGEDLLKVGKLNLVDLAGSEAIGRSGAVNQRAREAGMINQSLLTLGRVISALVEKSSHIPYRESKLTRLLQDSLGGRTKTCIVAAVSPTKSNMEETLSTLDYAIRAKTIRNKPEVNQKMTKGALIKEYVVELERLKQDLMAAREKNGVYFSSESWREMTEEQENRRTQLEDALQRAAAIENKHATMSAEFEANMAMLVVRDEELRVARAETAELGLALEAVRSDLEALRNELEEERMVSEAYRRGEAKLDRVAKGLKGTVEESVKDVGGLFAKIARKDEVMMINSAAANTYSSDLAAMADQLRKDVSTLQSVQSGFGKTLQSELEAFAARGAESLEQDKLFLDRQLEVFAQDIAGLQDEINVSTERAAATAQTILDAREALERSLRDWMSRARLEVQQSTAALGAQHSKSMEQVESSIKNISQMLDGVIAGALEHKEAETEKVQALVRLQAEARDAEIFRLQSQNAKLTEMLHAERDAIAKAKDDMLTQIANLLAGFTQAQDQRLAAVVNDLQRQNAGGLAEVGRHQQLYEVQVADRARMAEGFASDMQTVRAAAEEEADAAVTLVRERSLDTQRGIQALQETVTKEVDNGVESAVRVSRGIDGAVQKEQEATKLWATQHTAAVGQLHQTVGNTYATAKERLLSSKEDIKVVSHGVLAAHAAAEPIFAKHCAGALGHIADVQQANATFVSNIKQDLATGSTPRKKVWNVPSGWQLTGSRDSVLDRLRRRQLDSVAGSVQGDVSEVGMVALDGEAQAPEPVREAAGEDKSNDSQLEAAAAVPLPLSERKDQENLPPATEPALLASCETSPVEPLKTSTLGRPAQTGKARSGIPAPNRLNSSQLGRSKLGHSEERDPVAALGETGTIANTGIPMRRAKRA